MYGFNCRVSIFRYTNEDQPDTAVGGAGITGTLVHERVLALIQDDPEEPLLIQQQGLEVLRTQTATVVPGTLDIRERDELEVTEPVDHFYYGDRFRIIRTRNSSHNLRDPRRYMILSLTRSLVAHAHQ